MQIASSTLWGSIIRIHEAQVPSGALGLPNCSGGSSSISLSTFSFRDSWRFIPSGDCRGRRRSKMYPFLQLNSDGFFRICSMIGLNYVEVLERWMRNNLARRVRERQACLGQLSSQLGQLEYPTRCLSAGPHRIRWERAHAFSRNNWYKLKRFRHASRKRAIRSQVLIVTLPKKEEWAYRSVFPLMPKNPSGHISELQLAAPFKRSYASGVKCTRPW